MIRILIFLWLIIVNFTEIIPFSRAGKYNIQSVNKVVPLDSISPIHNTFSYFFLPPSHVKIPLPKLTLPSEKFSCQSIILETFKALDEKFYCGENFSYQSVYSSLKYGIQSITRIQIQIPNLYQSRKDISIPFVYIIWNRM